MTENRQGCTKRRIVLLIVTAIIAVVVVSGAIVLIVAKAILSPGFMMSGDCPEGSSYGSSNISGTAQDDSGNPVPDVKIIIYKAKGACPQSVEEQVTLLSDENGNFNGDIYVHLGDPAVSVSVSSEGYQPHELNYHAAQYQFSIITLTITVSDVLDVQWSFLGHKQATLEAEWKATIEALHTPTPTLERSN